MQSLSKAITDFFQGSATANLTAFFGALTLLGTATMALIQAVKDATPARDIFQRWRMRRWLREGAAEATTRHRDTIAKLEPQPDLDPVKAEADLICLAVDNDADAFYDLTVEQMCAQMNSAVQMVIESPKRHVRLLLIVGSFANTQDLATVLGVAAPSGAAQEERIALAEARNRVSHQLQRAIDAFQISTAFRWKWILQIASFIVTGLLAAIALNGATVATIVLTAIFAGFLAPVARDLTAALQKLRAP